MRRARREDLETQLNKGALWAVTYGDLMSYLMIFFLIMFSLSANHTASGSTSTKRRYEESLIGIQKVFGGQGSSPTYQRLIDRDREESMVTRLREAIGRKNLSQYAQLEAWDKKIRLVLANGVLFESGSSDLTPRAKELLAAVAAQLKPLENPVVIEGHTDNIVPPRGARYGSNWELSMARAYSVLRFFEANGVSPQRLSGIGYGEYRPIANNDTAQGRAKNRRIEIDLIRAE